MSAPAFKDPNLPAETRARDLVARLTLEEKISQMVYNAPAIPRLDIPEYNWWNEALHGVGRAGIATVFPQAIGLAATFDTGLVHRIAAVIADEARAKHHEFARQGYRRQYQGLTFWSPNVNIFRDPRWGRGQETFGEDPWLTGRMGVAFVRGLQGDDPRRPKVVATPKHFAVHSGPESMRHQFDARVCPRDLRETYLPAFRDCVVEGRALSVMGAYNRTNGEPCCASVTLLKKILRDEWGFDGYVVSDCGAIADFHLHHTYTGSPAQSAALAVRGGCDLECGSVFPSLLGAVADGLVTEKEIDAAVERLFRARFLLGMLDPGDSDARAQIPYGIVDSEPHRKLAREAARASVVLLKNARGILPLRRDIGSVAVIGPNADEREVLLGNYAGQPSRSLTVLDGIRAAVSPGTRVIYARGSEMQREADGVWAVRPDDGFAEALAAVDAAEVAVLVLGIDSRIEGEEGDASASKWSGDRIDIRLPSIQRRLFAAVAKRGKPVVLVLLTGSPIAIPEENDAADAVVLGWYPGEEGGGGIADVLFGVVSPSGRLPVTFVRSSEQLPPFTDYAMKGRTYRYLAAEPLYPFGYGLSYTSFRYSGLVVGRSSLEAGADLEVSVSVTNTGKRDSHEVVQLYLGGDGATAPLRQLVGFARVWLPLGATEVVHFTLGARQMSRVDEEGRRAVLPGRYRLFAGGHQPDSRSAALCGTGVLQVDFEIT
ncbi:MAG TPA: glycoside hydrolase family 3 C-terminal domain-containing protein, partial [Spirochaetia bacterium]